MRHYEDYNDEEDYPQDHPEDDYPQDHPEDYMSYREIEECDRLDYAREVEESGDPERAAEIRMGA